MKRHQPSAERVLDGDRRLRALAVDSSSGTPAEQEAPRQRRAAILTPSSTYNDLYYLREVVAEAILESSGTPLRTPAILAGLGFLSGTVASVWSLFLPPA